MGVKDLWHILTPHADRKPICELRGKIVAIDLAGWVCESLNVVDYFVHPRQHLKNLFFRTCYLIWEDVIPVFVLEGTAPKLKNAVIAKRNELQFRGVKPKSTKTLLVNGDAVGNTQYSQEHKTNNDKGRTRFNHVLKQCENLLKSMGIKCVQGPGEAEAYCAFLNRKGLVDGVISQDSDCFAYGALRVYRNFSISTQGAQSAQGGSIDIYDMNEISKKIDIGQHKIIVMALLCGCDYCPDGIGGIGRDSVLKLFKNYKEKEILNRIRSWRREGDKYSTLEMRVDDKNICAYCGHLGRTASHTKYGCGICRSKQGCDETLWKEQRLSLKAELAVRKKALSDPTFPNEEIITEFLSEPPTGQATATPTLNLNWQQPNIVKFIKKIGHLLQWTEIYCFQKFLPIVTRWQLYNIGRGNSTTARATTLLVELQQIVKKRTVKGCASLEIIWHDKCGFFDGLIPDEQLQEYEIENAKGLCALWTTIEPLSLLEMAYPDLVAAFMKSKEKPPKKKPSKERKRKPANANPLGNMQDLLNATNEIINDNESTKRKPTTKKSNNGGGIGIQKRKQHEAGMQTIDKFFKQNSVEPAALAPSSSPLRATKNGTQSYSQAMECSTPIIKNFRELPSDIEDDDSSIAMQGFNMSDIISDIVRNRHQSGAIGQHAGHALLYESLENINSSIRKSMESVGPSLDDADLLLLKRSRLLLNDDQNKSLVASDPEERPPKLKMQCSVTLDDSFDVLVNAGNRRLGYLMQKTTPTCITPVERFKRRHNISTNTKDRCSKLKGEEAGYNVAVDGNSSFFYEPSSNLSAASGPKDAFEEFMEASLSIANAAGGGEEDDCIVLSDD